MNKRDEAIKKVLGLSADEVRVVEKVFDRMQTRADIIKSLDKNHKKMSKETYKMHICNVLSAMADFGNSNEQLFPKLAGSLAAECLKKSKELREKR